MGEFRMPSLGADMAAGTLVEWLKQPGDAVRRGDTIAVVETQKGAIEIETFEDGVLDRPLVEIGAKVPVGTPLAFIRTSGEVFTPSVPSRPVVGAPPPQPAPVAAAPVAAAPLPPAAEEVMLVSPAARKLAAERGVALAGLKGSGPGGAIISTDVEQAPTGARPEAAPAKRHGLDLAEMRKAIAAAMARSKREIPHYYLGHAIDMTTPLDWLRSVNATRQPPERLLPAVLLLKAVALALEQFPEFNGFYSDGAYHPSEGIHIGTAIAIRGGGLVAPAIRDADEKTLDELMAALRDLVARHSASGCCSRRSISSSSNAPRWPSLAR